MHAPGYHLDIKGLVQPVAHHSSLVSETQHCLLTQRCIVPVAYQHNVYALSHVMLRRYKRRASGLYDVLWCNCFAALMKQDPQYRPQFGTLAHIGPWTTHHLHYTIIMVLTAMHDLR